MDIKIAPNKVEYQIIDLASHIGKGKGEERVEDLDALINHYAQAGWFPFKEIISMKLLIMARHEKYKHLDSYWDTLDDDEDDEEDEDFYDED